MEEYRNTPEKFVLTYEVTVSEGETVELVPPDGTVRSITVVGGFGEIRVCDNYYIAFPGRKLNHIYRVYCAAISDIGNLVLEITDESVS